MRRWRAVRAVSLVAILGLLFAGSPAKGQGFMVRPMTLSLTGRPGQALKTAVTVTNTKPGGPQTLRARLLRLGQSPSGTWRLIDPNDSEGSSRAGRSCYDWTSIDTDTLTVEPMKDGQVWVTVRIPIRAWGGYGAALVIASSPPPRGSGIGIVFQFLIPVIVRVQGPVARQVIHVGSPTLADILGTAQTPATTVFAIDITNSGDTYETVGATANILLESRGKWRKVARVEVDDHGLLPGLTIAKPANLGKRLPGGKYRIQGALRLGGVLKERFDNVVEFAGDPSVKEVEYDVDLLLQPASLGVSCQPGARRSAMLTIENPSPETVHVRCAPEIPRSLSGVALGDLVGEKFSCVPWLKVSPDDFQLAAGGKRTVRVDVAWPAEETKLPVHYANVVVLAGYDSGGSAGRFVVPLTVREADSKPELKAGANGLDIAAAEPNKCAVSARFFNIGLAEWSATAEFSLGSAGGNEVATSPAEVDVPVVLPLGQVQLSGTLDLTAVLPGTYALRAKISFGGVSFDQVLPVNVELKDKVKVATVVQQKEPATPAPGGAKDGK